MRVSLAQAQLEMFARRGWSLIRDGRLVSLDLDVWTLLSGACWIARLFTPLEIRRRGYAREAMEALCAAADKSGVILVLSINAYGTMSREALFRFYSSLGFETPPDLAEELMDGDLMVREPRK